MDLQRTERVDMNSRFKIPSYGWLLFRQSLNGLKLPTGCPHALTFMAISVKWRMEGCITDQHRRVAQTFNRYTISWKKIRLLSQTQAWNMKNTFLIPDTSLKHVNTFPLSTSNLKEKYVFPFTDTSLIHEKISLPSPS